MIHIHSGDSSMESSIAARIPGEHLSFREALVDGPAPRGLTTLEWIRIRSDHLARRSGRPPADVRRVVVSLLESLNRIRNSGEEIVLWFANDLFCQANLAFVIERLTDGARPDIRLASTHDPPSFEGAPQPLDDDWIESYRSFWLAYASADVSAVISLIEQGLPSPLREAAVLHRDRLPSERSGLGRLDELVVAKVAKGRVRFDELFRQIIADDPGYGFGDLQIMGVLEMLASGSPPVIQIHRSDSFSDTELSLTNDGNEIIEGSVRFSPASSFWIGGIMLCDQV